MDIKKLNEERKRLKLSVEELADRAGLPKSTLEKILFGIVKNPRLDTVEAIERALGLQNETSQLFDSTSELTENFVRDNLDLIQEKNFNDLTKLYRVMTVPQRMQALAYIVGFLTHAGVNTQAIVGY